MKSDCYFDYLEREKEPIAQEMIGGAFIGLLSLHPKKNGNN